MLHTYYLLTINQVLTDDIIEIVDDVEVVTLGQKSLIKTALLELGDKRTRMAYRKTHLRASVNHQKIIIEMETPVQATKTQFCNKMAELLPWSAQTISNKVTIKKMTRKEAMAEIKNHAEEWGEESYQ